MTDEYREYRRKRRTDTKNKPKNAFLRRLLAQTIISSVLLASVYMLQGNPSCQKLNEQIEAAIFYQPDISGANRLFSKFFQTKTEKGTNNEENTTFENL